MRYARKASSQGAPSRYAAMCPTRDSTAGEESPSASLSCLR